MQSALQKIAALGDGLPGLRRIFTAFRRCIERIGYLQFQVNASPEELHVDERTKTSADPFEVWGGRREHFMLVNLQNALAQNPPPLITTMGAEHARHQREQIRHLLRPYSGMLIIGGIVDLADIGAAKLAPIAESLSFELAQIYGWSEGWRKDTRAARRRWAMQRPDSRAARSRRPATFPNRLLAVFPAHQYAGTVDPLDGPARILRARLTR